MLVLFTDHQSNRTWKVTNVYGEIAAHEKRRVWYESSNVLARSREDKIIIGEDFNATLNGSRKARWKQQL